MPRGLEWRIDDKVSGLDMRLSEAEAPYVPGEAVPAAPIQRLDEATTARLLARLPPLQVVEGDRTPFAKREDSPPPPRTGDTVSLPFPPPAAPPPPAVEEGPLRVIRFGPEGEVPLAPHLSVTFSQPMVALTSQAEASKTVPVELSPAVPGAWRWVGTRTLLFEPEPRFPMATEYQVRVRPDARSAKGVALAEGASWSFATPPVKLVASWPADGPHPLDPKVFVGFDQAVDDRILEHLALVGGAGRVGLRRVTSWDDDPQITAMAAAAEPGRFLVLVPTEPLQPGTGYQIRLSRGAPSGEGPRTTTEDQQGYFSTYQPLAIERQDCSWGIDGCLPDSPLWVTFNNPLRTDADEVDSGKGVFDPASVTVEPAIENLRVRATGRGVTVYGNTRPGTSYAVRFAAGIPDVFGQTLKEPLTRTFQVGHANPQFQGPDKELLILDPAAPPAMSVYTVNHERLRVRVYRVKPTDFAAVSEWMRNARYDGEFKGEPSRNRVFDKVVAVPGYAVDEQIETPIDLSPWLTDGHGHVVVWVEPVPQKKERWERQDILAWVQVTDVGLTAFVESEEILGWATSLRDGKPLAGVELSLLGSKPAAEGAAEVATTGADGLARLGKYAQGEAGPHALLARHGTDVALLPEQDGWWQQYGSWHRSPPTDSMRWFVFDDRAMYRPGEMLHLKGWVRRYEGRPGGRPAGLGDGPDTIQWTLRDSLGVEHAKGEIDVDDGHGFSLELELPKTPNLGYASLDLSTSGGALGGWYRHGFQIQEFRRPEFEVTATADPRPYLLGERALVTTTAAYYAGGSLPDAPVDWTVTASPTSYVPPNRSEWRFGRWSPWWWYRGEDSGGDGGLRSLQGKTDGSGSHTVQIDFLAVNPPRTMAVVAEASVIDVNRQRWAASQALTLHPAAWYVGLKPDKGFYERGEKVKVEAIVVDLEGAAIDGVEVDVRLARMEWERVGRDWKEVEKDPETCHVRSNDEAVTCSFTPALGGTWQVTARITDREGRPNETSFQLYVAGGGEKQAPKRTVEEELVVLVPGADTYQPGDVAHVFVRSPFAPAEGVLQLRRNGILETRRFTMAESTTTLDVPIADDHQPSVTLEVDLVGAAERRDDDGNPLPDKARRVAYASGSLELKVPPLAHTLKVEATPAEAAIDPGGTTKIEVRVRDRSGQPVRADVAVVVVDESVLALTRYQTPDPLAVFWASPGPGVAERHDRALVVLANPLQADDPEPEPPADLEGDLVGGMVGGALGALGYARDEAMPMEEGSAEMKKEVAAAPMRQAAAKAKNGDKGRADFAPAASAPAPASAPVGAEAMIEVRKNFDANALFAPRVRTDPSGRASVEVTLPDSLTRYRVMAIAVAGEIAFGSGESSLTARKPVMLRPSPPRFLNFGDRAEIPFVVQNRTESPLEVQVAARVANLAVLADLDAALDSAIVSTGRSLTVPAHDRREVRIPVATDMAGTARVQAVVAAGSHTDAAVVELPVWTPATSEAFATYGEIDGGAMVQPVEAPPDVWTQFGGLEISTSSTALQALTDALLYLHEYPYDCSEQIASRVMAVAALRDVLVAFDVEQLQDPEAIDAAVERDLERLARRQDGNGGWGFWGTLPTEPFLTVHVADALIRARAKGYRVDESMVSRALYHLGQIESFIPGWYSREARWTIIAHALFVRHLAGDEDPGRAEALLAEAGVDALPLEAHAWILPVLHQAGRTARVEAILRHLDNRVTETAATAQFDVGYTDDNDYVLLHSSRRTDAIVMEALMRVAPAHDLPPKVTRGLLGHRVRGHWGSTQENAYVLLALDLYFRTYEAVTPDFVARVWLGDDFAGEHAFRGRTTETARIDVPMGLLADPGGTRDLIVAKEGPGRLYYRIGLKYAPKDLALEPADYGFELVRAYEAIDDPADVSRGEDGTWIVRSGARVRVRVTMVAPARRTHVMLTDPLPAGLEPMNPALAVTGAIPSDPSAGGRGWWWMGTWYQHQNLRDERVEAFTTLLWDGVWEYSYVATATTPGRYVVPPAKAEEMYHPETFGRTGTDRVVVR